MRKAAQRDNNEAEIVQALRKAGYHVSHLSDPGVPDLLVTKPGPDVPAFICTTAEQALQQAALGRVVLLEVKMPGKGLRPLQLKWFNEVTHDNDSQT